MSLKLEGSFVAIVTPFKNGGKEVDYEALGKLVEFQIANGTYLSFPSSLKIIYTNNAFVTIQTLLFLFLQQIHIYSFTPFLSHSLPVTFRSSLQFLFSPLLPLIKEKETESCQQGPQARHPHSLTKSTNASSRK